MFHTLVSPLPHVSGIWVFLNIPHLNNVQGGASWWTAEEENDRMSMEKTNYIEYNVIFSESVFV